MTTNILASPNQTDASHYRLPEEHRQALLAQSDSSQLGVEIERKRHEFMRRYGDAFGVNSKEEA